MLRLTSLANKYRKRTLRVLYGQTQTYPFAAQLDAAFDRTAGALSGGNAIAGAGAAIIPGLVAVKKVGETVTVSGAAGTNQRAFGLFANFVGGDMNDQSVGDSADVGVWRGGGVFHVLAPAFSDANSLASAAAAEDGTVANEIYLGSNAKGQLEYDGSAGALALSQTARLIQRLSSKVIEIELLV
jgi:hypothetical protein